MSSLASLNAIYTDSEGSDPEGGDDETPSDSKRSWLGENDSQSLGEVSYASAADVSGGSQKKKQRLVSYPGEGGEEEEGPLSSPEPIPQEEGSSDYWSPEKKSEAPTSPVTFHRKLYLQKATELQFPSKPEARCSNIAQETVNNLFQKFQNTRHDLCDILYARKDLRNPSIYEKLIAFCNIDERGTNFPPELYDPKSWGPESYYDELAKRQKEEMDKRDKERKDKTKVEFISGTKKADGTSVNTTVDLSNIRKSKWDAQPIKPILSAATGTKPVISAFGAIAKKSK